MNRPTRSSRSSLLLAAVVMLAACGYLLVRVPALLSYQFPFVPLWMLGPILIGLFCLARGCMRKH